MARASARLGAARGQAGTALGFPSVGTQPPLVASPEAGPRTASQWVSRHATHIVILIVVAGLAAFGGMKVFSPQSAYTHALSASQANTGTDFFEDESDGTHPDTDSADFQLVMPRTQVENAPVPANGNATGQASTLEMAPDVTRYTVAQGDTVESVAEKFNVMPETVMGSNGIFDSLETLAPGRTLVIPPVDGMYYVAQKDETIESVAHRFQVEPEVISSYPRNAVNQDGSITEGRELVVPGGMMPSRDTVITYTVRKGDSLRGIAARFGVDTPTMLHANDIPDPDHLQPGSQLRVLPVPGVEYKVKKGDNLNTIADSLGVSPQMILDYQPNNLTVSSVLQIDQVIMVPGGDPNNGTGDTVVAAARVQPDSRSNVRPAEQPKDNSGDKGDGGKVKPAATATPKKAPAPKATATPKPKTQPKQDNSPKVGTGRLIWPVSAVITQYFSKRHNGLDLATRAGTPIHAADSGRIVWSGWRTDGLGYCVIIDHLNGITTVYGHMIRQPPVRVGQYVSRGQVIGYVGSTGRSTGPHVHFMVKAGSASSHAYRNPLSFLGR